MILGRITFIFGGGMEQQNLFVSENISRIEEEIVKFQAELEDLIKIKIMRSMRLRKRNRLR